MFWPAVKPIRWDGSVRLHADPPASSGCSTGELRQGFALVECAPPGGAKHSVHLLISCHVWFLFKWNIQVSTFGSFSYSALIPAGFDLSQTGAARAHTHTHIHWPSSDSLLVPALSSPLQTPNTPLEGGNQKNKKTPHKYQMGTAPPIYQVAPPAGSWRTPANHCTVGWGSSHRRGLIGSVLQLVRTVPARKCYESCFTDD